MNIPLSILLRFDFNSIGLVQEGGLRSLSILLRFDFNE